MFERITARRIALLLAAAALAMTAAACGDDEDDASSSAESAAAEVVGRRQRGVAGRERRVGGVERRRVGDVRGHVEAGEATADTSAGSAAAPTVTADLGSLSGKVAIDGSSTVAPLTSAAAEEFPGEAGDVQVTVGTSGTGGGFERFCNGETDISNASRPIEDEETPCADKGVEFTELERANDGLTIVVNLDNDWAPCLTVEQLKTIWKPRLHGRLLERDRPVFPDEPLDPLRPGHRLRHLRLLHRGDQRRGGRHAAPTTRPSEDDNMLVQGVAGDQDALGYFGYAYYEENQNTLKDLEVDGGAGCVAPSTEPSDGTYRRSPPAVHLRQGRGARPEVAGVRELLPRERRLARRGGSVHPAPQPPDVRRGCDELCHLRRLVS